MNYLISVSISTPSTISPDKLNTVVVDVTVNGAVPVDISDLNVLALIENFLYQYHLQLMMLLNLLFLR